MKYLRRTSALRQWAPVAFLLLTTMVGCETPTGRIESFAQHSGFVKSSVRAGGFKHLVFSNQAVKSTPVLHVYLEGDGSPWRYRTVIMPDPTPRRPLMLRLMTLDQSPSVYVGRPCYNGTSQDAGCDSALWTSARYSSTVVNSMAQTLHVLARRYRAGELWLFGHSGGGALAMLLADRVPAVTRVVTLAGNLDTDAWTQHHGYTPLYSSLNPARQPPLRTDVFQWHLLGGRDQVIPPELVKPFIVAQQNAVGIELPRFGHGCCWEQLWPRLIDSVQSDAPARVPGSRFK